jgi:tetratricopeptide (TPR) repeat protein
MPTSRSKHNSGNLSARLDACLCKRDVKTGMSLLEQHFRPGVTLDPNHPEASSLLLALAQWVDLGFRDLAFLEEQFTLFQALPVLHWQVAQYQQIRVAESYIHLARRNYPAAIRLLEALLHLHGDSFSPELRFITHFWLARALRESGNFEQAFQQIRAARHQADGMQAGKLQAVTKIHESWLLFYRGDRRMAFQLLDEAEKELVTVDHALSLGDIASARGRFVRNSGDYERALGFYEYAVESYARHNPAHPSLARALVNAAYIKRLMVLDIVSGRDEKATAAVHGQTLKIVHEAMDLLQRAGQIYAQLEHQAGSGSVRINLGHLKLESGEIAAAAEEADAAFALGHQKSDQVLMARARILQAYVQMARADEQLDDFMDPLSSAQKALQFAEDAISLAESTQNNRLIAGAYITHGLALTEQPDVDWELARGRAEKAAALLPNRDRDHLFWELNRLKERIAQPTTMEGILRRWLSGELGSKSFQQIEEEFAEIVIPKVWLKLGRNISRVAQQLNVSPKKVRRALRNARMLNGEPVSKTRRDENSSADSHHFTESHAAQGNKTTPRSLTSELADGDDRLLHLLRARATGKRSSPA